MAFILACAGLYALLHALPEAATGPVNEHTARALGLILNLSGTPAETVADTVTAGGLAFRIIPECTPVFTSGLFFCFVSFHSASLRQKAAGIAWGFIALYVGNLLRLAMTFMISRHDKTLFALSHVYLGQIFTLVLVFACCLLWMRWIGQGGDGTEVAGDSAGFLIRFGLISAVLFIVWLEVHHGYIWILDQLLSIGFSLAGSTAGLARRNAVYYETFSIVIVLTLVLAARRIAWRSRALLLGAGLGLLFLIHLLHRLDNAFLALFNSAALQPLDLTALVIGQYLVPVLILVRLAQMQRQAAIASP